MIEKPVYIYRYWTIIGIFYIDMKTIDDAKDSVTSIEVTDHEILTGSADSRIRRYDLRSGEMLSDYMGS